MTPSSIHKWTLTRLFSGYDTAAPSAMPSESMQPSSTPSEMPSDSMQPSSTPSEMPSAQPTCLKRSTKSPGKGKGMKMGKTTKTAAPTGCLEAKSPGKGMRMGGKGMMRGNRQGGKGMMMMMMN